MKILVLDIHELLDHKQHRFVCRKLRLSLARFAYQIKSGTVELSKYDSRDSPFSCKLSVDVEVLGVTTTHSSSETVSRAVLRAIETMQLRVANRLKWHSESANFWTWSMPISKRLNWQLALNQPSPYC